MQNMNDLIEKKNEIQREIRSMKKERLLHTFLNILKLSYPANLGAAAQIFGYLGIIASSLSLISEIYLGDFVFTLFVLGGSSAFAGTTVIAAYVCYDNKEYLDSQINLLKQIDNNIQNYDYVMDNSNKRINNGIKLEPKNNIIASRKSRVEELKKYKEKLTNDKQQIEINKKNKIKSLIKQRRM